MSRVHLYGAFDNVQASDIRLMDEAANLGSVTVHLWSDEEIHRLTGSPPGLPLEERLYWLEATRYVAEVAPVAGQLDPDELPWDRITGGDTWVVRANEHTPPKSSFAFAAGLRYEVLPEQALTELPESVDTSAPGTRLVPIPSRIPKACGTESENQTWHGLRSGKPDSRQRVVVTGCYDFFHTGHVRFFEEVSALGALYVVLGHDANVRALKGDGHPMFPDYQRWYMVQSIRYVEQALISSGDGWLDAKPEMKIIQPHIYAVNEDGDKPIKRQFCKDNGIEYVVLKREPKEGLAKRSSTDLRGF